MITKAPCGGNTHTTRVTFSLPATFWADTIALIGDFANGSPTMNWLYQNDMGWQTSLVLPIHQTYQYHFLLDGTQWMTDWNGDGFGMDQQGRTISILTT